MTIKEALGQGAKLVKKSSASPLLDSEVLLCFALKKPKIYLYSNPNKPVPKISANRFEKLILERAKGRPVAQIVGHKEFFGIDFIVNEHVLVPRPETESMVEKLVETLKGKRGLNVLDVGTGSGCIIVSLAKNLPGNKFFASDVSEKALNVAKKNAKLNRVKVNFRKGNLTKPWPDTKFDVVVANLPYGWKGWKNNTSAATIGLKFEPKISLFAGNRGLELIDELLSQMSDRKFVTKIIAIEFDPRQITKIRQAARRLLPHRQLKIFKDLSQKPRFALLKSSD